MIISTTRNAIESAMAETRAIFGGNIEFRSIESTRTVPVRDSDRNRFRATITVRDSAGSGASWNPGANRRISAACWHVHGLFFAILIRIDPNATIRTFAGTIDRDGGNWRDFDRGSIMKPSRASEWCHCSGSFNWDSGNWIPEGWEPCEVLAEHGLFRLVPVRKRKRDRLVASCGFCGTYNEHSDECETARVSG